MADAGNKVNAAVNTGLAANMLLAVLKMTIGIFGHSQALLADGVNSTSDVAYYVVVKVFMAMSGKPPDREHPYGHRQMESIAALVVGAFVITTAVAIFWDAVNGVYDVFTGTAERADISQAALWVALLTVGAKIVLSTFTRRMGQQTQNAAVLALAMDHRNDMFSAAGAAVGIALAHAGFPWADPLFGAIVAGVVLITGLRILHESSDDLMDAVPVHALEQQIRIILREVAGVQKVEEILAHRFGPYFVINVTIGIDGNLSVTEGDSIASRVEEALMARMSLVQRVYIHYHPAGAGPDAA